MERELEDLDHRFNYHAPDDTARGQHQMVRDTMKGAALDMTTLLPNGREKSLCMTKLEEAMFWANAAIARNA